jgi:hypothetical protein
MREHSDPEVTDLDLLGYLSVLWHGKWLIFAMTVAALVAGLGYALTAPVVYQVRSQLKVDLYSIDRPYNCGPVTAGRGIDCYERGALMLYFKTLGPEWALSDNNVATLNSTAPDPAAAYSDQLASAVKQTNEALLNEAKLQLKIGEQQDAYILEKGAALESQIDVNIGVGRVEALLQIAKLEAGVNAIQFATPAITKTSPNLNLILFLALATGMVVGAVVVTLRAALRGRQTGIAK